MIYENEELRLRTIEISAEVDRGQSEVKKLRKENEMLKKEIWWLRDEYDRLEDVVKHMGAIDVSSTYPDGDDDGEVDDRDGEACKDQQAEGRGSRGDEDPRRRGSSMTSRPEITEVEEDHQQRSYAEVSS
jgi:hypothetical protein